MLTQQREPLTFNGLPFQGEDFSWKELDRTKPVKKVNAYAKTFVTTSEVDMKEYADIWRRKVEGSVKIGQEQREYDVSIQGWRIFLLWCELYYVKGTPNAGPG